MFLSSWWYYQRCVIRNRMAALLRRLRQPKYVIGLVLTVVYFGWICSAPIPPASLQFFELWLCRIKNFFGTQWEWSTQFARRRMTAARSLSRYLIISRCRSC